MFANSSSEIVCNGPSTGSGTDGCGDPISSSSGIVPNSSSSEPSVALPNARPAMNYSVSKIPNGYRVQFAESGSYRVYLLNPMGQIVSAKNVNGTEVEFHNLPKGRYIVKIK